MSSGYADLIAALIGAGSSYLGGQQAAGAIPATGDMQVTGYDPKADPLLAYLYAGATAGVGATPDSNILQAASPLNRLENSLLNSLGRNVDARQLRFMNQAMQSAQQVVAQGISSGQSPADIANGVENAFISFRGPTGQTVFDAAQKAIASGANPAQAIQDALGTAKHYQDGQGVVTNPEGLAKDLANIQSVIDAGTAKNLSGDELARFITDGLSKPEKSGSPAGLFRTALSSAGFNDPTDLITQEVSYRQRADTQNKALGSLADSRLGARNSANRSIDQILQNYPVYDASNIDQMSRLAVQPYQAQELEQANALGYNPATNLALTRSSGIRDALSILSGRQGLANTALLALRNELGQQTGEALSVSGQSQSAQANAANLASQQAIALNQIGMSGAQYQGSALGGGTAAAGAYLSDYFSNLGQPGQRRTA